jgi:hypothetical protein
MSFLLVIGRQNGDESGDAQWRSDSQSDPWGQSGQGPLCGTKVLRRYDDQWNRTHTVAKPLAHDFVPEARDFFGPNM